MSEKWIWRKWWIAMWAVAFTALVVSAFIVDFKTWAGAAAVGFGVPEGFAIWDGARRFPNKRERYKAPYPPLTYVTRFYLPRWLTYTLTGGLTGAIGASWFGMPQPWAVGGVFALFSWLIEHWEVTYDDMPMPK